MATNKASELIALRDKIERLKTNRSRIEGELISLKKQLKEEFGTDDIEKVQAKVVRLQKEAGEKQEQFDEGLNKLKEELDHGV